MPDTETKFPDITVELVGRDGNAFAILGKVKKELRRAGHRDAAEEYVEEATAGNYDELLQTTMQYVNVK